MAMAPKTRDGISRSDWGANQTSPRIASYCFLPFGPFCRGPSWQDTRPDSLFAASALSSAARVGRSRLGFATPPDGQDKCRDVPKVVQHEWPKLGRPQINADSARRAKTRSCLALRADFLLILGRPNFGHSFWTTLGKSWKWAKPKASKTREESEDLDPQGVGENVGTLACFGGGLRPCPSGGPEGWPRGGARLEVHQPTLHRPRRQWPPGQWGCRAGGLRPPAWQTNRGCRHHVEW